MRIKNECLRPISLPKLTGVQDNILRCGKCSNCLRQRANELAVRAYREYHGQSASFITFTYDDEHLPIQRSIYVIDKVTGEILNHSQTIERNNGFFDAAPFESKIYYDKGVKKLKRYAPLVVEEVLFNDQILVDAQYMTVYYEDVKKLFKRFRKKYSGVLNSFVCVPEYGGKGYRPHYHLLAFGLSKEHVEYLINDWQSRFGYAQIDKLDCHDDVSKISMYVSKYCTKGSFDCPHIFEGYCIKPRRCVSENFGCGSAESWIKYVSYVCAFDKFGEYDPLAVDGSKLSENDIKFLVSRRTYKINGFNYPNPKFLLRKVFNEKEKLFDAYNRKVVYRSYSSSLQRAVTRYILNDLTADARKKRDEHIKEHNSFDFLYAFDFGDLPNFEMPPVPVPVSTDSFDADFRSQIERNSVF